MYSIMCHLQEAHKYKHLQNTQKEEQANKKSNLQQQQVQLTIIKRSQILFIGRTCNKTRNK